MAERPCHGKTMKNWGSASWLALKAMNCLVVGPFFRSTKRIWRFDLTNHWIQFLSWNLIKKKIGGFKRQVRKTEQPKKGNSQVSKKNRRPGLLVAMLAPMYTSGSSGQIGHAGEAVGSRDQLRVKQWPWRELRAAAFLWRYSTGYLRRGQEMRTDNTTTSSAQPKNPKVSDVCRSPNFSKHWKCLFLSSKTSPKLGADVPKLPLFISVSSAQKSTRHHPASPGIQVPSHRRPRRWSQRRPHQKGRSKRPNGPRHHNGPTCTAPIAPRWFWCTTCFLRQK